VVQLIVEPYSRVYVTYLVISFSFKCVDVVHVVVSQCAVDVFFIDWERPAADSRPHPPASSVCLQHLLTYL